MANLIDMLKEMSTNKLLSFVYQSRANEAVHLISELEKQNERLKNELLFGFNTKPEAIVFLFGPSQCHIFHSYCDAKTFKDSGGNSRMGLIFSLQNTEIVWHRKG